MERLTPLNEDELIKGIKENNSMVISYVYRQNYPTIANFVRLNGGNDDDAKDIFQEAMIVLFNNLHNPEFKLTSRINTFLYSVARNLWLTELRRLNKLSDDVYELDEQIDNNDVSLEEIEHHNLRQKRLSWSLEQLGEPCKSILSYFYFYQWTMQEIAEKMGYTNAENAKNQKYKCLLRLKKIFQKF